MKGGVCLLTSKQRRVLFALDKVGKYDARSIMKKSRIKTVSELEKIIMELFRLDYLKGVTRNSHSEIIAASLDTAGKNYRQLLFKANINFVVGILVGVVTSIAGAFIYDLVKTIAGK